ncbi:4a-hydroxytetrahydrobiopterin dehydratase [Methyloversatilis sp. XJ19-49]|uniref:4a-hydroxytetrahydrobiopterin dehydratase n=1 Tax=Methyloversatilis sp. XJ19-49 TaxID=2963429 RepID=UPI00211C878D|nr:4a-hydroxytetrahydrobiopterin dehydratase [Methyloversatilis sp. XJ19-49]MCQ9377957.1 4a-hydroxytetrahydrobiopterin dehydratase [Methyloversatilis sp. XJ19-49]
MDAHELAQQHCTPQKGAHKRLTGDTLATHLRSVPGWIEADNHISKDFQFADYAQVVAFVNQVAALAAAEDHHPDIMFGFNRVRVVFTTHSVRGVSLNDLICAARIEAMRDL